MCLHAHMCEHACDNLTSVFILQNKHIKNYIAVKQNYSLLCIITSRNIKCHICKNMPCLLHSVFLEQTIYSHEQWNYCLRDVSGNNNGMQLTIKDSVSKLNAVMARVW